MHTALKRDVSNMWDVEKDKVLRYLYDAHENALNYDDTPILTVRIADDVDVAVRDTTDILRRLAQENLVEVIEAAGTFYRISPAGVEYVERALRTI